MDTDTQNPVNKFIRIEDGPTFGSGALNASDDQLFSSLAHLFALIVWFWKKSQSPAVDAHGKEALNMGITLVLFFIAVSIVGVVLPHFLAVVFGLALNLVSLAAFALFVYGFILARQGKLIRYPFNLRLIK